MLRSVLWLTAVLAATGGPALAQSWFGTFTLSGWLPTISGDERLGDRPAIDISRTVAPDPAFLASGTARRGRLGLLFDLAYVELSAESDGASASTDTRLRYASGAATWRFHDLAGDFAEAYGGLRAVAADVDFDVQAGPPSGSGSASAKWVDPIVGVRGEMSIADALSLSGLFDVGGFDFGGSDLTYQVYGGLNYGLGPSVQLTLGYHYMSIDYQDEELGIDVDIQGPVIGLTYLF